MTNDKPDLQAALETVKMVARKPSGYADNYAEDALAALDGAVVLDKETWRGALEIIDAAHRGVAYSAAACAFLAAHPLEPKGTVKG